MGMCHSLGVDFKLRVLIVDDDPLVCSLLAEVIWGLSYETKAALSAAEARKICQSFDADVAIIDVDLGGCVQF
jgi:CheY-like chemotaxis protein